MSATLTWRAGGSATLVALTVDAMTVRSTVPSPPGSRIAADVEGGGSLTMKVHASRKQDDGSYVLEGRPIDLGRDLRERLAATL